MFFPITKLLTALESLRCAIEHQKQNKCCYGTHRGEKRPIWLVVILSSLAMSAAFLSYNLREYMASTTVTNLSNSQATLEDNVFFPAVTVCSSNQMRLHNHIIE